ncbi:hypothetical protein CYMTET_29147 [Cymbomonas tetramitiformis]|uniref:Uncharacterized protein n=1 Tax=Cymbomonas tetramitiformis TaxID=36881 RepID=A0AAE0KVH7_9CHLO|nr:hypothetical protein CYMTET_29147 [Cymbomonas tetramitiformis]
MFRWICLLRFIFESNRKSDLDLLDALMPTAQKEGYYALLFRQFVLTSRRTFVSLQRYNASTVSLRPFTVAPHGSTDADAFVDVQLASLDELYEVFNNFISDQTEEIDYDALIDINVLGLDLVLDVPRVRAPLFTASSSVDDASSQDGDDYNSLSSSFNLLLGQCTCVYGCDNITSLTRCAEANGCSYLTGTTDTSCPSGYWEDVECTSYGMVDFEYCCPLPDGTCDPTTSGCHYLGDIFSTECPTGFTENHQCTRRGYLMDEEFCCPTTECSVTGGCFWNRDALQHSVCPSGYEERPSCTNNGYLWDEEFCCPEEADSAAPSGSDSPAPSPEPPNAREPGDCREYGGCYFHETFYAAECPAGYFELTECTDYGYFVDSEFCCPS